MKQSKKKAKPSTYNPDLATDWRRSSYHWANRDCPLTAAYFSMLADKEDAKEPAAWRYAGASKLGVEGI